jgi:hypothetical protein
MEGMKIPRVLRRIVSFAARRIGDWRSQRRGSSDLGASSSRARPHENHADEATIRHMAEAELGGMSSAESREAYLRGDNPGGLHRGGRGPRSAKRGDEEESIDLVRETLTSAPQSRR